MVLVLSIDGPSEVLPWKGDRGRPWDSQVPSHSCKDLVETRRHARDDVVRMQLKDEIMSGRADHLDPVPNLLYPVSRAGDDQMKFSRYCLSQSSNSIAPSFRRKDSPNE